MLDIKIITEKDKTLNALQKIQLEGLKELDRICRKHNIKYSLGGGTCLGQIRHGGFIPWDDDIDVDMTAENYEKFLKVAQKEINQNQFFLRCRKTDKNYLRTCSRLENRLTAIGLKKWDKQKIKVGIFIDIFEWNYLPNNAFLRKIVSSLLFYIRCIENYKMFHVYARKANPKLRNIVILLSKITPNKILFFMENRLKKSCGKCKTNWIIDDAIINGNHGGYPSEGIDEYEDVKFEGITVMNKKNPENFMKIIYGDKYNEWLPPVKRISHHKWTNLDYGVYKNSYNLPENYKDYLSISYTYEKLEHMKKISLEMAEIVSKICKENNLKYYIVGLDSYIKRYDVDELGKVWRTPVKIAMPREDYDKFAELSEKKLGAKYSYLSNKTNKEYKYPYARVRLNLTSIREAKTPIFIEDKYDNKFFIEIIPLENTSNDYKKRIKHAKKIRYLNHFILLKWKNNNFRVFWKKNIKTKIKLLLLIPFSADMLLKKLTKEAQKYNNETTDYYVDGTGYQLHGLSMEKKIFGEGKDLMYNDYNLTFPDDLEKYVEKIDSRKKTGISNSIKTLKYIKDNYYENYLERVSNISNMEIKRIQKKYPVCYLNYFDLPEYQLSVLRYDEKNDIYLSDEEILDSAQKLIEEVV